MTERAVDDPRPEDVLMLEQAAARFAREVIAKEAAGADAADGAGRARILEVARDLGLFALCAPEGAGGLGQDVDSLTAVLRPIAREDAGVSALLLVNAGAQRALAHGGAWPGSLTASELVTFPAFDPPGVAPRLRLDLDGRICGSVPLVPFADRASCLAVEVVDARGISRIAACAMSDPGIAREAASVVGLACAAPFDLRLGSVAPSNLATGAAASVDERHAWLSLGIAATALGVLEGALATALDYARQRRQGGRLIVEWPEVRRMLGALHASASLVASALAGALARRRRGDAGWLDDAVVVALEATARACSGTTDGVQLLGGNGYTKDYPQERRMRDARQLRAMLGPARERAARACDAWLG